MNLRYEQKVTRAAAVIILTMLAGLFLSNLCFGQVVTFEAVPGRVNDPSVHADEVWFMQGGYIRQRIDVSKGEWAFRFCPPGRPPESPRVPPNDPPFQFPTDPPPPLPSPDADVPEIIEGLIPYANLYLGGGVGAILGILLHFVRKAKEAEEETDVEEEELDDDLPFGDELTE